MGGGNKKNKRPSSAHVAASAAAAASLSTTLSPKTELIERTPDNDYGVLSDPDEQTTPITETPPETESTTVSAHDDSAETVHECNYIQNELLPLSHSSPQLSPLSPSQPPLIQPSIPEAQASNKNKSLETLKLKLTRDKNFSRKITLHTFFSFIILAMEIQRSCSASIAHLDMKSVEELVVYMIDNHSLNENVKHYLHTLIDTGVVTNIIESIVDFNRDNKSSSIETLYTLEENELEISFILNSVIDDVSNNTDKANLTVLQSTEQPETELPQTPQKCGGFFKRLRCFFSGCCG